MAENKSTPTIYFIPDNYIEESRIFQGSVKLRYFVEGVAIGLIGGIIALCCPISPVNLKIGVIVIAMMPGIVIGVLGYNGDPISIALQYMRLWLKNKEVKLYNPNPRILASSPTTDIIDIETVGDKIVDLWDNYQKKRIEKREAQTFIEGETFEFKKDHYVDDYAGAPMTEEEYQEYLKKLEEQKNDDGEIRIVSKLNLDDLDDISALDEEFDYSVEKN